MTFEEFFSDQLRLLELSWEKRGLYMPALAARLRVAADELADKYPDDVNGGRMSDE